MSDLTIFIKVLLPLIFVTVNPIIGREVGVSQSSLLLPDQKPGTPPVVPIHFSVPRTQDLDALDTH